MATGADNVSGKGKVEVSEQGAALGSGPRWSQLSQDQVHAGSGMLGEVEENPSRAPVWPKLLTLLRVLARLNNLLAHI